MTMFVMISLTTEYLQTRWSVKNKWRKVFVVIAVAVDVGDTRMGQTQMAMRRLTALSWGNRATLLYLNVFARPPMTEGPDTGYVFGNTNKILWLKTE
jgi:hypothetical protein